MHHQQQDRYVPYTSKLVEEEEDGFIIRKGNQLQYTNSFLDSVTEESQDLPFPGLNKRVKMFKFHDDSAFNISNINSRNLTCYFAIQFSQLDYDEDILEGDNFSIKISDGNLVLAENDNKKAVAVKTRRLYFLVFIIDSKTSKMTLRLDMFEESLSYSRERNIGEIKYGGDKSYNTQFTGRMGNFIFVTRTYSIEQICDSSRLCQLVEDECSGYIEESRCNRSSNKQGTMCEYNVVCVPIAAGEDRDRCSGYKTGVECNNDDKCMVDTNLSKCREAQPLKLLRMYLFHHMALPTTTSTQDVSRPPRKIAHLNQKVKHVNHVLIDVQTNSESTDK